ncbi:hypothetical protein A2755_00375 [Candidatus Wolfebacteria bacterium RIFCSPHIGHO2_01_FULL_48_22]|uniref:Uncharacterized protein n=1 Tax=Candidatus Wolfebacteria bacterium RIFCSPHIGHO2_01_FULL_48_22 TaxID=1802555 RepID=A0A1F8DWZ6_9BACT|nr:MAG: hypothetical protein A2755_00375 [Candidatus Wolfebacteria bacterium RIFCSPHIGHO2_01_FULL_48_22]
MKIFKTFWGKAAGYILAGFGLVAALAWNDAIQTLVNTIFTAESNTIIAKFIYALIITLVLVIISLRLEKKENK